MFRVLEYDFIINYKFERITRKVRAIKVNLPDGELLLLLFISKITINKVEKSEAIEVNNKV